VGIRLPWRVRAEISRLKVFLARERLRGVGPVAAILIHLPTVVSARLYLKLTSLLNGRFLNRIANGPRFRRFHREHEHLLGNHFYVIVVPGTLHFLLPCLDLLLRQVRLVFVFNGTRRWERRFLRQRYPELPAFSLLTVPASIALHGDVLSLLIRENKTNFGVLDHDLYVFGKSVFEDLGLGEKECVIGLVRQRNETIRLDYPATHFLFFNTRLIQSLMDRHNIDAGFYRKAPRRLHWQLAGIGLVPGKYLKAHHNFFDTFTLLLSVAFSEGCRAKYVQLQPGERAYHIGGTSWGTHRTRDLAELYINLRFLERIRESRIQKGYAYLRSEFPNSTQVRTLLPDAPEVRKLVRTLNVLIGRLDKLGGQDALVS
jgi:hypothetical protein